MLVLPPILATSPPQRRAEKEDETYNAGVPLGRNARVLRPKGVHDAAQGEVDAAGHEGRADGQAADLDEEAVLVPLVLVAEDAADVSDDLAQHSEEHGHGKGQAPPRRGVDDDETNEGEAE